MQTARTLTFYPDRYETSSMYQFMMRTALFLSGLFWTIKKNLETNIRTHIREPSSPRMWTLHVSLQQAIVDRPVVACYLPFTSTLPPLLLLPLPPPSFSSFHFLHNVLSFIFLLFVDHLLDWYDSIQLVNDTGLICDMTFLVHVQQKLNMIMQNEVVGLPLA